MSETTEGWDAMQRNHAALLREVERLREALTRIANGAEHRLGFVAQRQIAADALSRKEPS